MKGAEKIRGRLDELEHNALAVRKVDDSLLTNLGTHIPGLGRMHRAHDGVVCGSCRCQTFKCPLYVVDLDGAADDSQVVRLGVWPRVVGRLPPSQPVNDKPPVATRHKEGTIADSHAARRAVDVRPPAPVFAGPTRCQILGCPYRMEHIDRRRSCRQRARTRDPARAAL